LWRICFGLLSPTSILNGNSALHSLFSKPSVECDVFGKLAVRQEEVRPLYPCLVNRASDPDAVFAGDGNVATKFLEDVAAKGDRRPCRLLVEPFGFRAQRLLCRRLGFLLGLLNGLLPLGRRLGGYLFGARRNVAFELKIPIRCGFREVHVCAARLGPLVDDHQPHVDLRPRPLEDLLWHLDDLGTDLIEPVAEGAALLVAAEEGAFAHDCDEASAIFQVLVCFHHMGGILPPDARLAAERRIHQDHVVFAPVRSPDQEVDLRGYYLEPHLRELVGVLTIDLQSIYIHPIGQESQKAPLPGRWLQHLVALLDLRHPRHKDAQGIGRLEEVQFAGTLFPASLQGFGLAILFGGGNLANAFVCQLRGLSRLDRCFMDGDSARVKRILEVEILQCVGGLDLKAANQGSHILHTPADLAGQRALEVDVVGKQPLDPYRVIRVNAVACQPPASLVDLRCRPWQIDTHLDPIRFRTRGVMQRKPGATLRHRGDEHLDLAVLPRLEILLGLGGGYFAGVERRVGEGFSQGVGDAGERVINARIVHRLGDHHNRLGEWGFRSLAPAATLGPPSTKIILIVFPDALHFRVRVFLALGVAGLAELADGSVGFRLGEDDDLSTFGNQLPGSLDARLDLCRFEDALEGVDLVHLNHGMVR